MLWKRLLKPDGPRAANFGIYVSYGIPKSGSTYAFELTRRAFEEHGWTQRRSGCRIVERGHDINFVRDWHDHEALRDLLEECRKRGTWLVTKTHRPPSDDLKRLASEGYVRGHAVYRDPRDVALSMRDHGERARRTGESAFSKIHTVEDAKKTLHNRLKQLRQWEGTENLFFVNFPELLDADGTFLRKLEAQMGIAVEDGALKRFVQSRRFTQFNVGQAKRYLSEMTRDEAESFADDFRDFLNDYFGAEVA